MEISIIGIDGWKIDYKSNAVKINRNRIGINSNNGEHQVANSAVCKLMFPIV